MVDRYRSTRREAPKGTARSGSVVIGGNYTFTEDFSDVSDTVRDGTDCDPFHTMKYTSSGCRVNGTGTNGTVWSNYSCDVMGNWDNFPHHTFLPGSPSDVSAATEAAARTNPSRPYVDIPVNIAELADIPELMRGVGLHLIKKGVKNIPRVLGATNLAYNFGVAPLVGDLVKLINFKEQLNRRVKIIEKLKSSGGYRKTVTVAVSSAQGRYGKTLQSTLGSLWGEFDANTVEIVKVHCRWLPGESFTTQINDRNIGFQAARAVLGMTFDSSTLWEALPWSWLIDWCSDVGNYLSSTRNIIPASLSGVHVMRHTITEYSYGGYNDNHITISPAKIKREEKSRKASYTAPVAHFPFLEGNQVGILASLLATWHK